MAKVIFENLIDKEGNQLVLEIKNEKAYESGKRLKKIFESEKKEQYNVSQNSVGHTPRI